MSNITASASTSAGIIAARLRDDINDGRWPDGAALRQDELATLYGVSRIPVREALNLLRDDGLVVIEPNRGAYVTRLRVADVEEIFDLRILLEADALVRAIPAHSRKTLVLIEAIQAQLELEDAKAAWIQSDRAFHEALYAPSGRPQTLALISKLRTRVERYGLSKLRPGSRREGWASEHRQLLAAVTAGDAEEAVKVLTMHLQETCSAVCAALTLTQT
ncbi:bacterial regulatory s, gntR family protein [Collimonas arenae]|uniref:Bacterial regulatory s, gntR family protein n=1 Tax=Collimonas arenae TaxID=279058 RepID=A0A127PPG0_9BURK|nr:GntR family transcriptional regulator [Collimonas arenae]AMO99643.1 bacterial regulatory s, gntR family protein [Collimonas arenae]AMP09541.1 bacterial regulatory s, gntR family protein [Collimonas arenae]